MNDQQDAKRTTAGHQEDDGTHGLYDIAKRIESAMGVPARDIVARRTPLLDALQQLAKAEGIDLWKDSRSHESYGRG